ncbi:MAG: carbonic anhydrase [Candidatus Fervidibacter sacchari]
MKGVKQEVDLQRFRSWATWKDEFSGNLAVFCSDERFVAATLEFLRRGLDMERCDLLVVAGGPAFIPQSEVPLLERLDLLIKAHKIERVVLIAHDDCGYYKHRYPKLVPERLRQQQREDLLAALSALRQKGIKAQAFFAFVDSGEVVFEEVKG